MIVTIDLIYLLLLCKLQATFFDTYISNKEKYCKCYPTGNILYAII